MKGFQTRVVAKWGGEKRTVMKEVNDLESGRYLSMTVSREEIVQTLAGNKCTNELNKITIRELNSSKCMQLLQLPLASLDFFLVFILYNRSHWMVMLETNALSSLLQCQNKDCQDAFSFLKKILTLHVFSTFIKCRLFLHPEPILCSWHYFKY